MSPFVAGARLEDPALLELVWEFGLNEDNFAAILFVPLLYVAWSDGRIQSAEASTIRKLAAERGLASTSVLAKLNGWLEQRPSESFFQAGLNLFLKIAQAEDGQSELSDIIDLCYKVAACAGGLFGLAFSVSDAERKVLAEIENVLTIQDSAGLRALLDELDSAEVVPED